VYFGQRWVGVLFTVGPKYAWIRSGPISSPKGGMADKHSFINRQNQVAQCADLRDGVVVAKCPVLGMRLGI